MTSFFIWAISVLALFGAYYALEWVIELWYSWPFEE